VNFELFSLAASAVLGCDWCMRAHERVVVEGGVTEEQVHDAIRIRRDHSRRGGCPRGGLNYRREPCAGA
jgi:AhpD family alkylhydroperoxidase